MRRYEWIAFSVIALVPLVFGLHQKALSQSSNPYLPPTLDVQIFGQTFWLADSPVALKIVILNRQGNGPVKGQVRVSLQKGHRSKTLFWGMTDEKGTANPHFTAPSRPGRYTLVVAVRTPLGEEVIQRTIQVVEKAKILLTTDKPLYRPGQTVHIRALCLRFPDLRPAPDFSITFEVHDPKGNRVFRVTEKTSRFGVAATEFPIADEVTLGRYRITARLFKKGQGHPLASAEKTVRIERYVLPKFKVTVTTEKRFYLPGEVLRGTVNASYFFGKPVRRGKVKVALQTFAAGWHEIATLEGRLNDKGLWDFETRLPRVFVGLPLERGKALLRIEATVTDTADHSEQTATTVPVSDVPFQISLVPESAALKPNLPMRLFVVTTYPDGTPARCRFVIQGMTGKLRTFIASGKTDASGIGVVTVKVPPPSLQGRWIAGSLIHSFPVRVEVTAVDTKGNRVKVGLRLTLRGTEGSLLLRADKAIARVGETLTLTVLTKGSRHAFVFFDAIVHGQTVLTKTIPVKDGRGILRLPLTPDLAGTLLLHAYRILKDGNIVRDTKMVFVEPANELVIRVVSDERVYRPGGKAKVTFSVTDPKGRPVVAALGITVVDESVFALAEQFPGLERLYFALEEALLSPRYEVHGWQLRPILMRRRSGPKASPIVNRQRAAEILFAAMTPQITHSLWVSTYSRKVQEVVKRWEAFLRQSAERIRRALEAFHRLRGHYPPQSQALNALVHARLLSPEDIRDPLGNPYRLRTIAQGFRFFRLISAGMDGKFDTGDDFIVSVSGRNIWVTSRRRGYTTDGRLVFWDIIPGVGGLRGRPRGAVREAVAMMGPKLRPMRQKAASKTRPAIPEGIHIRQFFPETLFVRPQIITDEKGKAAVTIRLADSITTWRLKAMGNTLKGRLGSVTFPLRVFQDFFVDLDLPVAFTKGDEVSVPIALYNYLAKPQKVRVRIDPGDGFELLEGPEKTVTLRPNEVTGVRFRMTASRIGHHAITVYAIGKTMSDAIRRKVEVLPDGKAFWETVSDRLTPGTRRVRLTVPRKAIPDSLNLLVRLYPGAFAQTLDGLEKLLRMPFGCFEQTSSVTYPNVLILAYLKRVGTIQPETEMKARQFITIGYQRLLTFEVEGGGFSWFGRPPAHKILTAYGLLEFADMARVHDVDPNLIDRTARWLIRKQNGDGSWTPDPKGIREGAINRQRDILRATAYITWALSEAIGTVPMGREIRDGIQRAINYLTDHINRADDAYVSAVLLNAFLGAKAIDVKVPGRYIDRIAEQLAGMATELEDIAFWGTEDVTPFYGRGESADLEVTALATYALLRHKGYAPLANKALTYLIRKKDAFGTWRTTQATIWALKAFLTAAEQGTGSAKGTVIVEVNGQRVAEWELVGTEESVRQVDASKVAKIGTNTVTIHFRGKGNLLFQASARYHLPWELVPPERPGPLGVTIRYDRTDLQVNETVTCHVNIINRRPMAALMVIVDIGIPPGFSVLQGDLEKLVAQGVLERFEMTPRQVICYLDRIEGHAVTSFSFRMRATMPVRAKTGQIMAYEYYAPQNGVALAPRTLIVR